MTELVKVWPDSLKFPCEQLQQVSCKLCVKNISDFPVAFKVKTTAPKKYCVRPNAGAIPVGGDAEITVTMQAQRGPNPENISKDKFLLQTTALPDGSSTVTSEMFADRECYDVKLKVMYSSNAVDAGLPQETDLKAKIKMLNATLASLSEERQAAVLKTQRLEQDLSRVPAPPKLETQHQVGFSVIVVFFVGLVGVFLGYLLAS